MQEVFTRKMYDNNRINNVQFPCLFFEVLYVYHTRHFNTLGKEIDAHKYLSIIYWFNEM